MSSERKTRGRQKVEMKKISNKSNLLVTFSKRRSGLFKKASELCTLSGAEVALIVFSPSEKVFSFGHPNVDTVIDRYLSQVPPQNNGIALFIEAQRNANVRQLNIELTQINNLLDNETRRHDELSYVRKMFEDQFWWAGPNDGMSLDQLVLLKNTMEDLKKHIDQHVNRHVIQGPPTQTLPYFVENGSYPNMSFDHQSNPQHAQMLPDQLFHNPMLQPHLFGFNNMGGGGGGYRPSGF